MNINRKAAEEALSIRSVREAAEEARGEASVNAYTVQHVANEILFAHAARSATEGEMIAKDPGSLIGSR